MAFGTWYEFDSETQSGIESETESETESEIESGNQLEIKWLPRLQFADCSLQLICRS